MAGQHILLGDFNLHHPLWGGDSVTSSHEMAYTLIQHTITAGLSLTLPAGTKTREASGSSSTLDLVFMSQWLEERLWHCSVDKTIDTGSDHWPIRTTINTDTPTIPLPPLRPQWKKANWEKTRAALRSHMDPQEPHALGSKADLDSEAERLILAMTQTIHETIPMTRPSQWAKPNWTRECQELTKMARHLRRIWSATRLEGDYIAYQTANNAKKRQIIRDKRKTWRLAVAQATDNDNKVWKLVNWATRKAEQPPLAPQFPPLIDYSGTLQTTHKGKATVLAQKFFPPLVHADLQDIPGATYPTPVQIRNSVTREDV